jgi:hypothetical protein
MVVSRPTSTSIDNPNMIVGGGPRSIPYVLGIVSGSIPITDTALHVLSRMGLGRVESADIIRDTIELFYN